jgi:integrase
MFPQENEWSASTDTVSTQKPAESEKSLKFPKRIKHRGKALATIYGRSKSYPQYRVAWSVNGKRRMKAFDHYGGDDGALKYAEKLVPDLAKGSRVTALSPNQANDALAALQRLESYRQQTGRTVSLLQSVSEYVESAGKLKGRTLAEAVDGYLSTVTTVIRKDLAEAVEEFTLSERPRTVSEDGRRAALCKKYADNKALILRRFADTFVNTAVCELGKQQLDLFFGSLKKAFGVETAKSRNHYRGAIRSFLSWCVRKDYLRPANRLTEADAMQTELANSAEVELYSPKEFRTLLEAAEGPMQALLAIGGLAGLRTQELLRLDWTDLWRIEGHIEVSREKAKTRQRRLVEIGPALAAWLEPFRSFTTGRIWDNTESVFQKAALALTGEAGVGRKENGLRHSYCTYHFALNANENLTAQQAGNSPAMIHQHYKGLATKAEAEKWFAVAPKQADNVISMAAAETN